MSYVQMPLVKPKTKKINQNGERKNIDVEKKLWFDKKKPEKKTKSGI